MTSERKFRTQAANTWHLASSWPWYAAFFLGAVGVIGIDEYALAYLLLLLAALGLLSVIWNRTPRSKRGRWFSYIFTALWAVLLASCLIVIYLIQDQKPLSHLSSLFATINIDTKAPLPPSFPPGLLRPTSPTRAAPTQTTPAQPPLLVTFVGTGDIYVDQLGRASLPMIFKGLGDRILHVRAYAWTKTAAPIAHEDISGNKNAEEAFWREFESREKKLFALMPSFEVSIPPNSVSRSSINLGPDITRYLPQLKENRQLLFVGSRFEDDSGKIVAENCLVVEFATNLYHLCAKHNTP
jgi:hypothetical protein